MKIVNSMISVIVPIYNVSPYLAKCLDSIKNQTYKDFEVLMVDDGSTDNSAEIAKEYLTDSRYKLYSQSNSGQGAARNKGLDNASGEYVCFIDSDDYISPEYLDSLYNLLIENDADIAQCGINRVWLDGTAKPYSFTGLESRTYRDIKKYIKTASFVTCNKLYKISLFSGIRFPSNIKFEDFVLVPQVYDRAHTIVSTEKRLYNYLWRNNSTTTENKIQFDILKAQQLLEKSQFGITNQDLIQIFFVRQVMGSLLWAMAQVSGYSENIKEILQEAKDKYPDLKKYIPDNIGRHKSFFGNQLLSGNIRTAELYARMYARIYNTLRRLYRIVR